MDMEPQQTNWIVNNDHFGASCIQIHLTLECIGLPRWSYLSYHGGSQAGADADTSGAQ